MAIYFFTNRFKQDLKKLTKDNQAGFRAALKDKFDVDLNGDGFRPGLRIKRVRATARIWEITWAPDGRATFEYDEEKSPGEPSVIWRRIGTHEIFKSP